MVVHHHAMVETGFCLPRSACLWQIMRRSRWPVECARIHPCHDGGRCVCVLPTPTCAGYESFVATLPRPSESRETASSMAGLAWRTCERQRCHGCFRPHVRRAPHRAWPWASTVPLHNRQHRLGRAQQPLCAHAPQLRTWAASSAPCAAACHGIRVVQASLAQVLQLCVRSRCGLNERDYA